MQIIQIAQMHGPLLNKLLHFKKVTTFWANSWYSIIYHLYLARQEPIKSIQRNIAACKIEQINNNRRDSTKVSKHYNKLREREKAKHTFDVPKISEFSQLWVGILHDALFCIPSETRFDLSRCCSLASQEVNKSNSRPGRILSPVVTWLSLKADSKQSLATSRASESTPGASSTAFKKTFSWLDSNNKNFVVVNLRMR